MKTIKRWAWIGLAFLMTCRPALAGDVKRGVYFGLGAYTDLGYPSTLVLVGAQLDRDLGPVLLSADVNYSPTPKSGGPITFREASVVTTGDGYLKLGPALVGGGVSWSVTKEEGYFKGIVRPEAGAGIAFAPDGDVSIRLIGKRIFRVFDNFNALDGYVAEGRLDVPVKGSTAVRIGAKVFWLRFDDSAGQRLSGRAMQAHFGVSF